MNVNDFNSNNLYDILFQDITKKYFESYNFYFEKLQVIFKIISYLKTNLNSYYINNNKYGLMFLDNTIYKNYSKQYDYTNKNIYISELNIDICIRYCRDLCNDILNKFQLSNINTIYLILLYYNFDSNYIDSILTKKQNVKILKSKDSIVDYIYNSEKNSELLFIKEIVEFYETVENNSLKYDIYNIEGILKSKINFLVNKYNTIYNKNLIIQGLED